MALAIKYEMAHIISEAEEKLHVETEGEYSGLKLNMLLFAYNKCFVYWFLCPEPNGQRTSETRQETPLYFKVKR